MKTAGVICECNPLHAGHRYLLQQAKEHGAEAVICVMSGCFVQRGEPALFEPRTRAEALLTGGADAVLELPFPYSAAGAEAFAKAGVSILERLGVQELWFGSECGELSLLQNAAELAGSREFAALYAKRCRSESAGTAKLYFDCLRELGATSECFSPNDILGISYLKELLRRGSELKPHTVRREGSGFSEQLLSAGKFPSASALRRAFAEQGISAFSGWMSREELQLLQQCIDLGLAPATLAPIERAVLSTLRLTAPGTVEAVPELGGGLGNRLLTSAHQAASLSELLSLTVTKKYPEVRVRRGILFAMLGVRCEDLAREPSYAVLLAANRVGCRFLADGKRQRSIPVVTSHGDLPKTPDAMRQEELTRRTFALYGLCLPKAQPAALFLARSAQIKA